MSDTKKCFAKCSFFFTNLFQDKSLYCPRLFTVTKNFFTVTKNFNTALTLSGINCIESFLVKIVVSFIKLLSINLDEYSFFLGQIR